MKAVLLLALAIATQGCSSSSNQTIGTDRAASASASSHTPKDPLAGAPPWQAIPVPPADVSAEINKSGREPYAGKTGVLTGRVTMTGAEAPATSFSFPTDGSCPEASATYGKAFRVGPDKGLADALVTVIGYDAFVPPATNTVTMKAHGCAFEKRTVAMTFGQKLDIINTDRRGSYTPFLDGAPYRAVMLAVPDGDPVHLYPFKPAVNYVLRDFQGRDFLQADVLVLKFSTLDVTTLDGRYRIDRIPVGKVTVNAFLPALTKSVEKTIEIKEGENLLDLELAYDPTTDKIAVHPPGPFARGSDPTREAAAEGKFGAPPKIPRDVPR